MKLSAVMTKVLCLLSVRHLWDIMSSSCGGIDVRGCHKANKGTLTCSSVCLYANGGVVTHGWGVQSNVTSQ